MPSSNRHFLEIWWERTSGRRMLGLLVGLPVLFLIGYVFFDYWVLDRQLVTVKVTEISAPYSCNKGSSRRSRRWLFPRYRSSTPVGQTFGYCGEIMTDHGNLTLPESARWNLLYTSREKLHEQLKVGCTYKIVAVGGYEPLRPGGNWTNKMKTLARIKRVYPCANSLSTES